MESIKSVFSSCPHSHVVYNKYTGQPVVVPCGNCLYCRMHKSMITAARIRSEAALHNFNLFFTLTYDNNNLPYAQRLDSFLETCDSDIALDIANLRATLFPGTPLGHLYIHEASPGSYELADATDGYIGEDCVPVEPKEFDVPNSIAILSKHDVQKFFKRLRYYIKNDTENLLFNVPVSERKFRYYICGEYGPNTFRPHYHGLFFCDDFQIASAIRSCYIYKAWSHYLQDKSVRKPIGRIDVQFAKNAASYVSNYIASFYSLPRILANGRWKPFYLSSKSPSLGVSENTIQKAFQAVTQKSIETTETKLDENGRIEIVSRPLSRSLISWLFPRCTGFKSYSKDSDAMAAIYFPCYGQLSRESLRYSKYHYDANRLDKDGNLGWFDENNIHCSRRAALVCKQFSLTHSEYIALLQRCYSLLDMYSLNESYRRLEEYSKLCSSEDFQRTLHAFFNESVDESLLPFLPEKLTMFDVSLISRDTMCLIDVSKLSFDDGKIDFSRFCVSVKKFRSIPRCVRDIFCLPISDVGILINFYNCDDDNLTWHLDTSRIRRIYDVETQPLIASQRSAVRDIFGKKLVQKKINQNQQACASLNKRPLD